MKKLHDDYKLIFENKYLKKYTTSDGSSIQQLKKSRTRKVISHIKEVLNFYNGALPYIKTLPSFHIGYQYATDKLLGLVQNHFNLNEKEILEIGCGLGNSLIYLAQKFNLSGLGIDLNDNQIEICKGKLKDCFLENRIDFKILNAMKITKNLGRYDIVWSEDSFSHIPNRFLLFKKIRTILKSKGVFVFSDLVKTANISTKELHQQQTAWSLWDLETYEGYLELLHDSGFFVIESYKNIGKELLEQHIKLDVVNGDISPDLYFEILKKNKNQLINEWGVDNYSQRYERLKTYRYIKDDKLDYNFFIAIKI